MGETQRLKLAPGIQIVEVSDSRFTVASDFVGIELSGETARDLVEHVLSDLNVPRAVDEIVDRMPGYDRASLKSRLDELVRQGILVSVNGHSRRSDAPFHAFLDQIGLGAEPIKDKLRATHVTIMGLEAHGAHIARILADAGVGNLLLVDPFPFEPAHLNLTPVTHESAVGSPRDAALRDSLSNSESVIGTTNGSDLTEELIAAIVPETDLMIICWDQGFGAASQWANRLALDRAIPTLFGQLHSTVSLAGPFFLPHRSACWMCYRMRSIACETDFELAMKLEEDNDRRRRPALCERALFPTLPYQLATVLGTEALKYIVGLGQPTLVNAVLEYNALTSELQRHALLAKPDCPVCSKKKDRANPRREEFGAERFQAGLGLPGVADQLVSRRTGVVAYLGAAKREPAEPPRPYVWRARISNHRFLSEIDDAHAMCSGKGMTRDRAWTSCLGEAVERYSGACWSQDELTVATRAQLDGPSMDPTNLCLYAPDQYHQLKYAPYTDDTELSWIRGRSLITDDEIWIPAIAVFMDYHVHDEAEFIAPVTSNGLAAGPTLEAAVLGAVYEVIERDALLIGWLNKLPGSSYDPSTHPDADVRHLAEAYRRRGVRLALAQIPTDNPVSVFIAVALQEEDGFGGPYATIGLGAHLHPTEAARQAAMEVAQVRPALRQRTRTDQAARMEELSQDPSKVSTLEDHALLYAHTAMKGAFDFLFHGSSEWPSSHVSGTAESLGAMVDYFRDSDQEFLYVNLTPPDMESLGLFTARAILPGYQPIWFGRGERRLGGSRLYELPERLGFAARRRRPEDLNPLPHPIA